MAVNWQGEKYDHCPNGIWKQGNVRNNFYLCINSIIFSHVHLLQVPAGYNE